MPTRLAKAWARVLPIAGAGISMFTAPTMRIPIGASDEDATLAERLQFTAAQGPCIDAHRTGQRVVATEPVIATRWPIFHDRLITQTPVRGIVAVPLRDGLNGIGPLDLYCHRSADVAAINPTDVDAIAEHITTTLQYGVFQRPVAAVHALARTADGGFGLRRHGGGGMLPGQAMRLAVARGSVSADGLYRCLPSPGGSQQVEEDPGERFASFGPYSRRNPLDALVIVAIVSCP